MPDQSAPSYSGHPIGSLDALARALDVSLEKLLRLASGAEDMYLGPINQKKKDGKIRATYDAKPALKRLHEKINQRILREVTYPSYLMGGLRDPLKARGYIRNAQVHAGAQLLVGEDVEDFFPSITRARVRAIFMHVFRFPAQVAMTLAKLCTRRGSLVQGAKTSTFLANLALYREEPALYRRLLEMGVTYTRFIDDMHTSVRHRVSPASKTKLVSLMRATLERAGLKPKRKKQFVSSAGSRMRVHGLNVNGQASKDRSYRHNLRADVFRLERMARGREFTPEFDTKFRQAASRIGALAPLNLGDATRLKGRLRLLALQRRESQRARLAGGRVHNENPLVASPRA
jgi:hypothetical protein